MFDLVISGGDSFTFGAELVTDNSVHPNSNSWANLVAQRIGKRHVNLARSGRSNSYITRHVLCELQQALQQGISPDKIFVQVMWTFTNRCEFAIGTDTDEYDSPWLGLTPYSDCDETKSEWFSKVDKTLPTWQTAYNSLKLSYNRKKKLGVIDFATQFKRLVQSNPRNDSYTSVKEILLLQNTLLLHKIPHIFTYVNQHVMDGVLNDMHYDQYLTNVRAFINHDSWFKFPGSYQKYIGFDDWARQNNYQYATSHPLESAHRDAADLIYNFIKSQGYVS